MLFLCDEGFIFEKTSIDLSALPTATRLFIYLGIYTGPVLTTISKRSHAVLACQQKYEGLNWRSDVTHVSHGSTARLIGLKQGYE